ncbi:MULTISPECIES: bifunctional 3,4-dihydroxy-2-butanone-4-phosphate synthase/GTP cyclohydrolase II [unclassified Undibacterium]|uniref:bifunctional 3,4-dihydroxy-2-butanone-4-phosphate synthase/GTP cyclohydrolase II n=1 Tax=unclassified Undibacterium TaxID=2630295 RepID=UPI002AC940BE|nr:MULTISPECIES: bifunctional 3,4-dihydroxy-2-butanone-4-phosphate synthase/GTP cyclohydrolase II [unclassified Undibacterium]MEB0138320.1 bifunctional 3,4-dihydroxy-2-butanone-4-phosphate synthase/GTP cyclohydrolase II [Undibacterium sp. CCC2.1]MEB0172697.1 bifunctional 3,4-dihydroxy-2-butanone-4-phosphate synthase/GTP cyclohydrolase II [Undibacterium sp. CCC1.1]MEB0174695.1 bifunctional 3,4-dihydroxy-2-butanone-4-phosphate synthase/GTP cyclohydrolase II [Undibacterium sp. CCC3.4]MEB0213892.1 
MSMSTTLEIVAELRAGRMVILVDEEDRENEGDLIMAAEFVTAEAINFMAKFGRGLVCLTLTEERCDELNLAMMTSRNGTSYGTNFTVSIEAAEGVTTGISAADRARTVQVAVNKKMGANDIVQPGHIFPLKAQKGGVLMRAGHTEAGCDLAELAGLTPAAVICEIMKDDGTMARLPDLIEFARLHELKIGSIADLIHYRSQTESIVERIAERDMHTVHGSFKAIVYRDKPSGSAHLALVHGTPVAHEPALVRVHQPVSILDLLESRATTHSWNLAAAMQAIQAAPTGVIVLINCEETAQQMFDQFSALNTPESRPAGRAARMDLRTYGIGAQILKDVGVGKMTLLANPRKMPSMTGFNLEVLGYLDKPHAH